MSALRHPLRRSLAATRAYATTSTPYVPPASLRDMDRSHRGGGRPYNRNGNGNKDSLSLPKPRPESPTFYTARSAYYDQITSLESAIQYARSSLRTLQLLPLPPFARASLPALEFNWKNKSDMESYMQCTLTTARYRLVLGLLNQLNDYRRIAHTAGCAELGEAMAGILDIFRKGEEGGAAMKKKVEFDEYGRTYTTGRRKTSAARVWVIPARQAMETSVVTGEEPAGEQESLENLLGVIQASPTPQEPISTTPIVPLAPTTVTPSQILINSLPLATYFALPSDREKITRPLKLAGVLGAYNIFALVRGGGTTGQSGAIAHGIAKGLVAHEPEMAEVLRKSKLLRRDPRMVERKKTGLAKARKRVSIRIIIIFTCFLTLLGFSMLGSDGNLLLAALYIIIHNLLGIFAIHSITRPSLSVFRRIEMV